MKKTAMQELIEHLKEVQDRAITESFFNGLQTGITKATELLIKEKEQIVCAYDFGWGNGNFSADSGETVNGKTFYDKMYTNE